MSQVGHVSHAEAINPNQNQILQASHHILTLLERSKEQLERFVDQLPSIFCVIGPTGQIIKGNTELSERFGCNIEDLRSKTLVSLFKPATWQLFAIQLQRIATQPASVLSFELPVDHHDQGIRTYSWSVRSLEGTTSKEPLFTLFGVDVTEIRAYERQLSQIFSTIPLGIMRVDQNLTIKPPVSEFARVIMNTETVVGKNLKEVLFVPSWELMSNLQREYTENLTSIMGFPEFQYEMIRDSLPRLVCHPAPLKGDPNAVKWIGINYDPIVQAGVIEGLLVILEDRTEVERMRQEQEARSKSEEEVIQRFIEVRRLQPVVRRMIQSDISAFIITVQEAAAADDLPQVLRTLHGIKGVSRVAQLTRLKTITHETESLLLGLSDQARTAWRQHESRIADIVSEWTEVETIIKALGGGQKSEPVSSRATNVLQSIAVLETRLRFSVEQTAQTLVKSVNLTFNWGGIEIPGAVAPKLCECLLHLLNNALDHGIEAPKDRLQVGKPEAGQITVSATSQASLMTIKIVDDGKGIDPEGVLSSALRKNVLSAAEAQTMNDEQKVNLIFRPGISTKETATDISGRGIGLDAVASAVASIGGKVSVATALGKGTTFTLSFSVEI